jgi:hypothetical protein
MRKQLCDTYKNNQTNRYAKLRSTHMPSYTLGTPVVSGIPVVTGIPVSGMGTSGVVTGIPVDTKKIKLSPTALRATPVVPPSTPVVPTEPILPPPSTPTAPTEPTVGDRFMF